MTRSHEQDHDRDHDDLRRRSGTGAAPGRSTHTQNLVGPNSPMPSGILMRKARDASGVQDGAEDAVSRASSSSGQALPADLRSRFEGSLGTDLSDVRVHTGSSSAAAADAVGARAYALGNDIHFGSGQFDPASSSGQHLLAHEVAHTVQQRGGSPQRQNKLAVSSGGDAAELEADRAADAMTRGSAFALSGASGVIARKEAPSQAGDEQEHEKKDKLALPKWTNESVDIPVGLGTEKFGAIKLNWKEGSAEYSKKTSASVEHKFVDVGQTLQSEIYPGVVVDAHYKVAAGLGASLDAALTGTWSDAPGPRVEEGKSLTVQASGGGKVEAAVKGSVGIGAGVGVANVASVVAGVEAGLEGKASIGCTLSGTVTRDPEGTISGSIQFTVDGGISLEASAALNVDLVLLGDRTTLYTVELAKATLGKVGITGGTKYENGAFTPVGGTPVVEFLELPEGEKRAKRKLTEKEKLWYRQVDQGASGAMASAPDAIEMTDEELFQAGMEQVHTRLDSHKGEVVFVTDQNASGEHVVTFDLSGKTFTRKVSVDPDPIYAPPEDQRTCKRVVAVKINDIRVAITMDQLDMRHLNTPNKVEDQILANGVDIVVTPGIVEWNPSPNEQQAAATKDAREQQKRDKQASEQANQSCDETRDNLAPPPQSMAPEPPPTDPFAPEPQSIE